MTRLLLVALLLLAGGCRKSPEEQAIELRFEARALLDALYASYGGGQLAQDVRSEVSAKAQRAEQRPDGGTLEAQILRSVGELALETDRAAFEAQCESLGAGERPLILNPKAKDFFARPEVLQECKKVAALRLKIGALERPADPPAR